MTDDPADALTDGLAPAPIESAGGAIRRLNLNLLYALEAVLRAPTLTEAAGLVSLSQPAISQSLRKLRDHFGDDLVIYSRRGTRHTELAHALRPRVHRLVCEADRLFGYELAFDPQVSHRRITLAAPEPFHTTCLAVIAREFLALAPHLEIDLLRADAASVEILLTGEVDIAIVPEAALDPRFEQRELLTCGQACVVWDAHPTLRGATMTLGEYLAARHLGLPDNARGSGFAAPLPPELAGRDVCVRASDPSALAPMLVGTDLILTTTMWQAQQLAHLMPLRIVAAPVAMPQVRIYAQWESHRGREALIAWALERLVEAIPGGARP